MRRQGASGRAIQSPLSVVMRKAGAGVGPGAQVAVTRASETSCPSAAPASTTPIGRAGAARI